MNSQTPDGGPAYPTLYIEPEYGSSYGGMTLRDYFAGQALAGMLANSSARGAWATYAEHSYAQADAMLAERGGKSE